MFKASGSESEDWARAATGIREIWSDYMSILLAQGAFALWTVLGTVLSARLLGPDGYGGLALFIGVVQFFFIVGVKWSFPAVVRFGREALVRERIGGRVFWAWVPLFAGSLLFCSLILVLLSADVRQLVGLQDNYSLLLLSFFSLTAIAMATVQFLQLKGRMQVAAWLPVIGRAVFVGLLTAFAFWSGWRITLSEIILLFAGALLLQVLFSLPYMGKKVFFPLEANWGLTRAMTRYSLPLAFAFLGAYISDWIDLYFLRVFRGPAEVGIYQVSYQALLFVAGGLIGLNTLAFPLLSTWRAEGRESRVVQYVVRLIPQVGVLWALCLLGIGIVHEPLFSALFGSEFAGSARFFSLLLISSAFQVVTYLYSPLFLTHDIPGQVTGIVVVMAGVNVLGNFLLIPTWGAAGAAISTSFSYAVAAWLYLRWGNRRIGVDRLVAFAPPTLVTAALLAAAGHGLRMRAILLLSAAVVLVLWARHWRIFSMDDLRFLDEVQLPPSVRARITRLYQILA